jgi:two-component system OmpR family response regulator
MTSILVPVSSAKPLEAVPAVSATHHILVVDDDPDIVRLVTEVLSEFDLRVSSAGDGKAMYEILDREAIDLIVLDVRLPGEDGVTLMRDLRARSRIPIIMLTSRKDDVDRILGLELGADDYVTKPFVPREFVARVRAVLRRSQPPAPVSEDEEQTRRVRFAGWELDPRSGRLTSKGGERVELTYAEVRLLQAFLGSPRRTLSRDQLLDLSHGNGNGEGVFDRSIDVQILRLRRKLEADPSRPEIIKTERGVGYFLDAKVETVS